jgi:hypothetical protein
MRIGAFEPGTEVLLKGKRYRIHKVVGVEGVLLIDEGSGSLRTADPQALDFINPGNAVSRGRGIDLADVPEEQWTEAFRYPACQACGFDLRLAPSRRMELSRHRLQVRLCALLDFLINRGACVAEIRAMLSAIRHLPRKSAFLAEDVGLNDLSLEQRFSLFNHLTPETLVDLMIGPGTRPQDRWHRHILRTGSLDDLLEAERDPRRSHPGPATPRRRP